MAQSVQKGLKGVTGKMDFSDLDKIEFKFGSLHLRLSPTYEVWDGDVMIGWVSKTNASGEIIFEGTPKNDLQFLIENTNDLEPVLHQLLGRSGMTSIGAPVLMAKVINDKSDHFDQIGEVTDTDPKEDGTAVMLRFKDSNDEELYQRNEVEFLN